VILFGPANKTPMNPILEGLVTTLNTNGTVNVSPMGPHVEEGMRILHLRPFQTSETYRNLVRDRTGVFHVTDDVEMLARAAVDRLEGEPDLIEIEGVPAPILAGACRWFAFELHTIDDAHPRALATAHVTQQGFLREFFGFNRAKHAVLEAAILATRLPLLAPAELHAQMNQWRPLVEKTGGPAEHRAWAFLEGFIAEALTAS
jgi:hypothetical protein